MKPLSIVPLRVPIFLRNYLGMTVNWLDPDDFSQKTATRCLRRIKGSITYDVLEMPIRSVLNEFAIYEKMGSMTTDGGSNFRMFFIAVIFLVFSSAFSLRFSV